MLNISYIRKLMFYLSPIRSALANHHFGSPFTYSCIFILFVTQSTTRYPYRSCILTIFITQSTTRYPQVMHIHICYLEHHHVSSGHAYSPFSLTTAYQVYLAHTYSSFMLPRAPPVVWSELGPVFGDDVDPLVLSQSKSFVVS